MTATTRNHRIQTLTVRDEQVTVIPMTSVELASSTIVDAIDALELPTAHQFSNLKGWNIYDTAGEHIGRILSRGGIMTAEWYDDLDQNDWLAAKWGCRRIERAIAEILILRDEIARTVRAATKDRNAHLRQEEFAAYLSCNHLTVNGAGDIIRAA